MTPILYRYQRRYLADRARFKAGMWSRQTGKRRIKHDRDLEGCEQ